MTASIRPTTGPAAASPVCASPAGPIHLLAGLRACSPACVPSLGPTQLRG